MQLAMHMVTIEDLMPREHFLRKLEAALDLSFVYEETAPLYSKKYGHPAIDPVASGTRKEDLLLEPQEAPLIWAVRRILANTNSTERAMDMLIKSLKQTETNQEFLVRTAKKAQHTKADGSLEF